MDLSYIDPHARVLGSFAKETYNPPYMDLSYIDPHARVLDYCFK